MTNSQIINQLVRSVEDIAVTMIKEALDKPFSAELFHEPTVMSFYPEYTMSGIRKEGNRYILQSVTEKDVRELDIEDTACVPITDLQCILEEIERHE